MFEPEAAVVRRIFHDAAVGGHSLREIIRWLAADAVPPPAGRGRLWRPSTLSKLLRNEAYIGRVYLPAFTLRTYTHLMPDSRSRTQSIIDASLRSKQPPTSVRRCAPMCPHKPDDLRLCRSAACTRHIYDV